MIKSLLLMKTKSIILFQILVGIVAVLFLNDDNGGTGNSKNALFVDAALDCETTKECEDKLRIGSKCINGSCSNPFVNGCIKTMIESGEFSYENSKLYETLDIEEREERIAQLPGVDGRVCNSDDYRNRINNNNNNNEEEDVCIENALEYPEIRIHNSNWESSIFFAWIMQIVSMEILKVPVSVGLNSNVTGATSFYSSQNTLKYSSASYPWDALFRENYHNVTSCNETMADCIEVMPEVWNSQQPNWEKSIEEEIIEPVDGCGQVGKLSWYIPLFTARKYPSLASYHGMQGEANRYLLAETFKRPTSWLEYCTNVSDTNCSIPDEVAARYPEGDGEGDSYFGPPDYAGYFEATEESDCTKFPKNCTGYMVPPPCSWSTVVDAQIYWNDIVGLKVDGPLVNGGYSYGQMIQIWKAANSTESDVAFWWWQPEGLLEEFAATKASFQPVMLPAATEECFDNRVSNEDRCSPDITLRRGKKEGSCEQEAHALKKIIASSVANQNSHISNVALKSPGYDFIRSLKISDLEFQSIFRRWKTPGIDAYGNDAREAVCSYVVENIDALLYFVPLGYPKTLDETISYQEGYLYVATTLAVLCGIGITVMMYFVYRWRLTKVFVYAQHMFIQIIMFGFLLVCIGALLNSMQPTAVTCVARIWFVNLGYNMELAAVLVKISMINRVMQGAKKLRRIKISNKAMFGSLGGLLAFATIFLIGWTVVSPPEAIQDRVLPDNGEDGENTIIEVRLMCMSEQLTWPFMSLGWQTLLLLVASVLAFQSRDIMPEFNESQSFGAMIFSHFLFMILRIIVEYLGLKQIITPNAVSASVSYLLSLDVLFATVIYVVPKCFEAKKFPEPYDPRSSQGRYTTYNDMFKRSLYNSSGASGASRANSQSRNSGKPRASSFIGKVHTTSIVDEARTTSIVDEDSLSERLTRAPRQRIPSGIYESDRRGPSILRESARTSSNKIVSERSSVVLESIDESESIHLQEEEEQNKNDIPSGEITSSTECNVGDVINHNNNDNDNDKDIVTNVHSPSDKAKMNGEEEIIFVKEDEKKSDDDADDEPKEVVPLLSFRDEMSLGECNDDDDNNEGKQSIVIQSSSGRCHDEQDEKNDDGPLSVTPTKCDSVEENSTTEEEELEENSSGEIKS